MSSNNKPLTKLSCEELVALLKQENINQKILTFLTEHDVNGFNFSVPDFINQNILCEETKATLKLLPAQVSTLQKVHAQLCASDSETTASAAVSGPAEPHQTQPPPASPITRHQSPLEEIVRRNTPLNTTSAAASSQAPQSTKAPHQLPSASPEQRQSASSCATSTPSTETSDPIDDAASDTTESSAPASPSSLPHNPLNVLKEEVQKFPELDDGKQGMLRIARGLLEEGKTIKGWVGTVRSIVQFVVSGFLSAKGEAKDECLKLINRVERLIAAEDGELVNNPPRELVPLFKEVTALAKEAKLLIAKFIPVNKEDGTIVSSAQYTASLLTGCKNEFILLHKKIDVINLEMAGKHFRKSASAAAQPMSAPAKPRKIKDLSSPSARNQFIGKLQTSCRNWYDTKFEIEAASNSTSKKIIKLEDLYVDLKIQHQIDATKIAESDAGEHADFSNLHKHLFKENDMVIKRITLIEGSAGCGKTTCCQELTRRQTFGGAIVIFVALKDLFGCGRFESIKDILTSVRTPDIILKYLPEILEYDIPIVWILDGFDEVMLTDDGSVRNFLQNFVDPATRRSNWNAVPRFLPNLVRACDAVIISSRENRNEEKNKAVVFLNKLEPSLAPDCWVIRPWKRPAIFRYVSSYFSKATFDPVRIISSSLYDWQRSAISKPISKRFPTANPSINSLNQIVDVAESTQMEGFHGIPLFIKLLCDVKLEDPMLDISKVTPPFLFQKRLRQAFDRAQLRISYVLNQDASWMKYEKDRDKLFHDIVLQNASDQALKEFLKHQGTALTFTVPNHKRVLWLSVMLEMGVLQRDRQSDDSFKFPHRTFIEFLAAKRIALNPESDFPRIPFKDEFNTTWLLLCQIANERDKDGFSDKMLTKGITSKRLATLVAKQFVAEYLKIAVEDRHSNDKSKIAANVITLSLKLLIQIAVALSDEMLMKEIINAHRCPSSPMVITAPSHLSWMIEWCGVFGAIKVLKWINDEYPSVVSAVKVPKVVNWIEKKIPSVVNAVKFSKDLKEQHLIRTRCRLGLARALQARGTTSSSLVEECIDFYLPRAGDLEAEDAVAADSHSALQQILKERPWQGNVARLSKLVLTCICKRKSHPNLLASLLLFVQLDEVTDKKKCMPLLQLALFFAPEKLEIHNEDKSAEIVSFAEKVKETQRWTEKPFVDEIFAEEELMKELLKNDNNIADAFRECSEIEVDDENDLAGGHQHDLMTGAPRPDTLSTISAEEFLHHGFARLKYGGDASQYVLDALKNELPLALKAINLSLCVKEISDASLETLLPKYSSSLQTLSLSNCNKITDSGLQYLAKLSSLQSLSLHYCKNITDNGLQQLSKLSSLQTLNLLKCTLITDTGLEHIAKLSSLQSLNLKYCNKITDNGLQHLAKLSSLQSLNLQSCNLITDSGLQHFAKLSSLQTLNFLKCTLITDNGLEHLVKLTSLQSLDLGYCDKITDSGLQHLSKLSSLQTLNLLECTLITDNGLEHLVKLSSLQSLNIQYCKNITDNGLQHLAKLSSLQSLNLQSCNLITDTGLQHLAKLSSLQTLNLASCKLITDNGLQHLAKLSSLQSLNLKYCNKITGNGFQHLAKLSSLQTLDLYDCHNINDSCLQHLAKLSSLQSLNLQGCYKITDNGLQHLTKLSSLHTLDLYDCHNITDNGLQHLAKLSSLQSLNLQSCKLITDSGLQHLAKLSSLQSLSLEWCDKITNSGLQHLRTKLPSIRIIR